MFAGVQSTSSQSSSVREDLAGALGDWLGRISSPVQQMPVNTHKKRYLQAQSAPSRMVSRVLQVMHFSIVPCMGNQCPSVAIKGVLHIEE
jgi:hypothetical protein